MFGQIWFSKRAKMLVKVMVKTQKSRYREIF